MNISWFFRAATAAGLLTCTTSATFAQAQDLTAAARAEGRVTWCNGSIADTIQQKIVNQFEAKYPGVRLEAIRSTSQVAYQRLTLDMENKTATCDIFSTSDVTQLEALHDAGHLLEYKPEEAANLTAGIDQYYRPGFYYPSLLAVVAIVINTNKVNPDEAPRSWDDLLDPKWKKRIAIGHPAYSGVIGAFALQMKQEKGLDWFKAFEANNPHIGRSANDAVTQLNSGERDVAIALSYTALASMWRGNPLEVIYPTDGSVVAVSGAGIIDSAPHPNAAKLFMEFLLSPEYSEIVSEEGAPPLNRNVALRDKVVALDAIPVSRPALDTMAKGIPEVIEDWRDIYGN